MFDVAEKVKAKRLLRMESVMREVENEGQKRLVEVSQW